MSKDYPFKTWDTYLAALEEFLQTEFYGETYPKYEKNHDDLAIVKKLVEIHGQDVQTGMERIINTITETGTRYAKDFFLYGDLKEIIDYLLSKGADLPEGYLYASNFEEMADEVQGYDARGFVIDHLASKGIITEESANRYEKWSMIDEEYDIDYELNQMEDPEEFERQRLAYLKSCSKFLANIK